MITSDEMPSNVIVLKKAVEQYISNRCKHKQIIVDAEHETVECGDCGEKLNPIGLLARFIKEESSFHYRARQVNEEMTNLRMLEQELANKQRCKCEHCGRFTKIDRRVPTLKAVK